MGMSFLSYCLHFHFGRRECPCSRRQPTVPKLLLITIIKVGLKRLPLAALVAYTVSSFYFVASWVQSRNLRHLTVLLELILVQIYF